MYELKNYGLDWNKQIADEDPEKDWIFGASSVRCIAEVPPKERVNCLPAGEVQQSDKDDMMDCATRGPLNILETKFNWLIRNNMLSVRAIAFLKQFMNDKGQVEISDAFTSIKSGTTKFGNSMKAPLDAIRKFGIVPKKLLPLEKWMSWTDFHNVNRITPTIEEIAKQSLLHFNFNYEKVLEKDTKKMLDRDILNLCGFAWPAPVNGIYPKTDNDPNHVFMGLDDDNMLDYLKSNTDIFDNYIDFDDDFIKKLAPDYRFWGQYRLIISENRMTETENLSFMIFLLKRMIEILKQMLDIQEHLRKISGFFRGLFKGRN
jgi:hypothetical protein